MIHAGRNQRKRALNQRELATVLAALRTFQERVLEVGPLAVAEADEWHFENYSPLAVEEIETLCEKLNAGEVR